MIRVPVVFILLVAVVDWLRAELYARTIGRVRFALWYRRHRRQTERELEAIRTRQQHAETEASA